MSDRHPSRLDVAERARFEQAFRRPGRPVVITGAMEGWPARSRWTLEAFRQRFGERRLSVIPTSDGRARFSPRDGIAYRPMSVASFLDAVRAGDRSAYMVFKVLDELPELMDDVAPPDPWTAAPWRHCRFWLAPPDVASPLHRDLPDNLYAQVVGRKQWILFDRRHTRRLYSHAPWSGTPNFSRADGERLDDPRFPRMRGLERWSVVLEPGEMLYIPRRWWHQARSIEPSVSMNFWWATGGTLALVRAAELFMKVRGLRL